MLHPQDAHALLAMRKTGVYKVKVGKLGRAVIVRLPKQVVDFYKLENKIIEIEPKSKEEIIIRTES
ncbi:MAG: hypothetical protein HY929_05340 [Euryarchaeota archaeon]|nr:hypothetical protein [Euryarchaeota archaeon]